MEEPRQSARKLPSPGGGNQKAIHDTKKIYIYIYGRGKPCYWLDLSDYCGGEGTGYLYLYTTNLYEHGRTDISNNLTHAIVEYLVKI